MGFGYILPWHGQILEDINGQRFFQLSTTHDEGLPTVKIPLIGKSERYDPHYSVEDGTYRPDVETYSCAAHVSARKHKFDLRALLQYPQDCPHVVMQIKRDVHDPMLLEAGLFPDATSPPAPSDPQLEAAWEAVQKRFATVFKQSCGHTATVFKMSCGHTVL